MSSKLKHITYSDALIKARNYCGYQERCHFEVEEKLKTWGLHFEFIPAVCVKLSEEGYLNEQRFVSSYIRGKLNQNGWGKLKIKQGLAKKRISKRLIEKELEKIDELNYYQKLKRILSLKKKSIRAANAYELKAKLYRFALSRGFESSLINEIVDEILTH